MTDRIIFLDIDGVILPTRMWAAPQNVALLEADLVLRAPHIAFDPGAIGLLVQTAKLSGAKFVLHSNWRRNWPGEWAALLEQLLSVRALVDGNSVTVIEG